MKLIKRITEVEIAFLNFKLECDLSHENSLINDEEYKELARINYKMKQLIEESNKALQKIEDKV